MVPAFAGCQVGMGTLIARMIKSLGQVAFEAYKVRKGGVAFDGTPIPDWDQVSDEVKASWEAAAQAVIIAYQSGDWYE